MYMFIGDNGYLIFGCRAVDHRNSSGDQAYWIIQQKIKSMYKEYKLLLPTRDDTSSNLAVTPPTKATTPTPKNTFTSSQAPHKNDVNSKKKSVFDIDKFIADRGLAPKVVEAFKLEVKGEELHFPYIINGETKAVKRRFENGNKVWRKEDPTNLPYGSHLLHEYKDKEHLYIVEGETDTLAVYTNGGAVLGSGTNHYINEWDSSYFEGFKYIRVILDHGAKGLLNLDKGALNMFNSAKRLAEILEGQATVEIVVLPKGIKDSSELLLQQDLNDQVEYMSIEDYENWEIKEQVGSLAEPTTNVWEIIKTEIVDYNKLYPNVALALVIAYTSRVLRDLSDNYNLDTPLSTMLEGQSSGGKNYHINRVKSYYPKDIFIEITASSDKVFYYEARETDFTHKVIIIDETTPTQTPEFEYMMRQLMSEGRAIYKTLIDQDPHELIIEGPIALVSSKTPRKVNIENQTRYVTVQLPNTKSDVSNSILSMTKNFMGERKLNTQFVNEFQALQKLLQAKKPKVSIPWLPILAIELANKFNAQEQLRDYQQLVSMIKTSTLLHYYQRETNEKGELIATLEDYGNIYPIADEVFGSSVNKYIDTALEVFLNGVGKITSHGKEYANKLELAELLNQDKSNIQHNIKKAWERELIQRNEELVAPSGRVKQWEVKLVGNVSDTFNKQKLLPTKEELDTLLNCESDIEEEAKFFEENVAPPTDTPTPTADTQGTLEEN